MFQLCTLEDAVRIAPQDLGKPTELAIEAVLLQTFVDKVIPDIGLVITLYTLLDVGTGTVYHSDGGAHYKVRFQLVVFRPFVDEILRGTVKDMDEHGVRISLGFFEDVRIPVSLLPQPARWQASDAEWSWLGGGPTPLYFQRGKEIRFKVRAVWFHPEPTRATQNAQAAAGELVEGTAERPHVPMEVQARADTVGLGMTFWEWGDT